MSVKHAKSLKDMISKIIDMKHSDRLLYLRDLNDVEFKLIQEIVINFMQKNLKTPPETFHELQKIKDFMRAFVSCKNSKKRKRALLTTLKGLRMVALLLPVLNLFLNNV